MRALMVLAGLAGGCAARPAPASAPAPAPAPLADVLGALGDRPEWRLISRVPLSFPTFHTQGLARAEGGFFLSAVELEEPPDRERGTPGRGVGHLFRIDEAGRLLADIRLGEGEIYHPGGIDSDGDSVWVPVAEYRPASRSIVYRVDAASHRAEEAFRFADHVGAVAVDPDAGELIGMSWGSRRWFRWDRAGALRATAENPSDFVDYQDCQPAGEHQVLCGGVSSDVTRGGLALAAPRAGRVVKEVRVDVTTPGEQLLTRNPVLVELEGERLLLYAVPDDDASTLFVYEAAR